MKLKLIVLLTLPLLAANVARADDSDVISSLITACAANSMTLITASGAATSTTC